jgi:predicted small secreted protein
MKKIVALCLGATFLLSACNTIGGIGRDLQSAGNSISKAGK